MNFQQYAVVCTQGTLWLFKNYKAHDFHKAVKHHMIAAGFGHPKSLKFMQLAFTNGDVTKGDYEE
jgi:hypothetical protein